MDISANQVRDLREKTGAGMMDCKKALVETKGDFEQAIEFLRKKGIANAAKKADRAANQGSIGSYIHGAGTVGVMVEVNCETDFVARTDQFQNFVKDISMHIAAASPQYIRREEVPAEVIAKEKEIFIAQMKDQKKPAEVLEKIAEGKIGKFFSEVCLLEQNFVKDPDKTIEQILKETIAGLGENVQIKRFTRYVLGEESSSTQES